MSFDKRNTAKRLPVCFCIDCSGSMGQIIEGNEFTHKTGEGYSDGQHWTYVDYDHNDPRVKTKMGVVNEAIANFYDALRDEDEISDSCEIELVTFDTSCSIYSEFNNILDCIKPSMDNTDGDSNLSTGINFCLKELAKRKKLYKDNHQDYFQPWLVILTDGISSENTDAVKRELMNQQNANKLCVYVINLKGASESNLLRGFSLSDPLEGDSPDSIRECFRFLARSVSVSVANGGHVQLAKRSNADLNGDFYGDDD